MSSGSYGIRYVNNMKELITAYKRCMKISLTAYTGIYPSGGDAFGLSALFDKMQSQRLSLFIKTQEYPITGGLSTLRESVVNDEVQELGIKLLKALKMVWRCNGGIQDGPS